MHGFDCIEKMPGLTEISVKAGYVNDFDNEDNLLILMLILMMIMVLMMLEMTIVI